MRKLAFLLALLPSLAVAQLSQRPYNPANVNITGGTIAASSVAATGGVAPSAAVSGAQLWRGSNAVLTFVDSGRSANNTKSYVQWGATNLVLGFSDDTSTSGLNALTITGGFGQGISSIASNSGTGKWTHTGVFTATGGVQLAVFTVATLPTCNAAAAGTMAAVSDATTPTYNGALTGGGSVHIPAYCNGTAWVAH